MAESRYFEVWPQLRLNYGWTDISHAGFEVSAYGLSDKTRLDAGDVVMANLTFTPELRIPLFADADNADDDQDATVLTLGPRLLCTQKKGLVSKMRDCGASVGLGLSRQWGERGSLMSITAYKDGKETRTASSLGSNTRSAMGVAESRPGL